MSEHVAEVPLPDAEENLRRLAAAVGARGGGLILAPEFVRDDSDGQLRAYGAMEAKIAADLPFVRYVDTQAAMETFTGETLLVDRNHLSRVGAEHLATVLRPVVEGLIGGG